MNRVALFCLLNLAQMHILESRTNEQCNKLLQLFRVKVLQHCKMVNAVTGNPTME